MSAEDLQALDAEQKRSLVAKIEAPYKSRADDVSNLASLPSLKREFVLLTSEHPPSPALKKLQADVVAKVPSELSDALKSMHISAAMRLLASSSRSTGQYFLNQAGYLAGRELFRDARR